MSIKTKGETSFIALSRNTLNSQAYKKGLTMAEKVAYQYLKKNCNGYNNGKIILTYAEMKDAMAQGTLNTALKGLERKGWIRKTQQGGMWGTPSMFELTGTYDLLYQGGDKKGRK